MFQRYPREGDDLSQDVNFRLIDRSVQVKFLYSLAFEVSPILHTFV